MKKIIFTLVLIGLINNVYAQNKFETKDSISIKNLSSVDNFPAVMKSFYKKEANKSTMNRFTEFINTASEELAKELISPDAIFYVPGRTEPVKGPSGYLSIIGMMRGGFPDIQWTLEETVAEGDTVAARFVMQGTHQGSFFGVPPTGKKIKVQAMNFYYFSNGKIIKEYGQPDLLELLKQIGAIPNK